MIAAKGVCPPSPTSPADPEHRNIKVQIHKNPIWITFSCLKDLRVLYAELKANEIIRMMSSINSCKETVCAEQM